MDEIYKDGADSFSLSYLEALGHTHTELDLETLRALFNGAHLPLKPSHDHFPEPLIPSTEEQTLQAALDPLTDEFTQDLIELHYEGAIMVPDPYTPYSGMEDVWPAQIEDDSDPSKTVNLNGCYHHLVTPSTIFSHPWMLVCCEATNYKMLRVPSAGCKNGDCYWKSDLNRFMQFEAEWKYKHLYLYNLESTDKKPQFLRPPSGRISPQADRLISDLQLSSRQAVASSVPRRVALLTKLLAGLCALGTSLVCGTVAWKLLKRFLPTNPQSAAHLPEPTSVPITFSLTEDSEPLAIEPSVSTDPSGFCTVDLAPQSVIASGDQAKLKRVKRRARSIRTVVKDARMQPQAATTANFHAVETVLVKNFVFIHLECEGRILLRARCLGLCGHEVLSTWHFVEQALDALDKFACSIFMIYRGVRYPLAKLSLGKAKRIDALGIFSLPPSTPTFRKITHLIATQDEVEKSSGAHNVLVTLDLTPGQDETVFNIWKEINCRHIHHSVCIPSQAGASEMELSEGFEYNLGYAGLCGAVIFDPTIQNGKLVGMHIAGDSNVFGKQGQLGLAAYIIQEEILDEVIVVDAQYHADVAALLQEDEEPTFVVDINAEFIGKSRQDNIPQNPVRTTIIPSAVAPRLPPPKTTPAPLSARDARLSPGRNPFVEGVEKHGFIPKGWDPDMVERCYHFLCQRFRRCAPVRKVSGKLTLQEAICGVYGIEEMGAIDMTTSPGYGWKKFQPAGEKGKRWLFDIEASPTGNVLNAVDDRLQCLITEQNAMREKGIAPPSVFTDCLKDTRIKNDKIHKIGCTRVFSLSQVEHTIACRQYTLEFVAAVMRHRIGNNVCVGINMDSLETTRLVNKHRRKGSRHLTGDYKAFGDTLEPMLVWVAFRVICDWYEYYGDKSVQNKNARMALWLETGQSLHAAMDLLYRVYVGLPSGSPLTVIINSMVNSGYMCLSFEEITGKPLETFDTEVAEDNYGDDVWLTVSDELSEIFNCESLSENFKLHNIVFTDATKTGEIRKWCSFEEVTFLKRSFLPHPSRPMVWLAALDWVSVEECAKWVHQSDDHREATLVNVEAAQRLAYGHGPQKFSQFTAQLQEACLAAGLRIPTLLPWDAIDRANFEE
nr:MAG: polyprotein [Eriocheir sinensis iflavirus]